MAKKGNRSKSPKHKGSNVIEGMSKGKKRQTSKPQGSVVSEGKSSKSNAAKFKGAKEKGDIKTSIVNDDLWKCTVVMIVCPPFHGSSIQLLNELPNTTVISSKMLGQTPTKKDGASRKSRGSTTTKASKGSKKTTKTKASKKKEKETNKIIDDEKCKINLEEEKLKLIESCTLIKQLVVNLRNSDLGLDKFSKNADKQKFKTKESKENKEKGLERKNNRSSEETNEDRKITHRYVVLSGFYSLMFPQVMNSLRLPVKALITVKLGGSILNLARQEKNPVDQKKIDPGIKRNRKSLDKSDEYNSFLINIRKYKRDLKYLEENKDLLFLNYSITEDIPDKSTENTKENVIRILNGIKRSWDKFEKFSISLDILEVPTNETLKLEDAKLYNTAISMVPVECVSIPVIIHCMLDQVHHWVQEEEHLTIHSVPTSISNDGSLDMDKCSYNSFNSSHIMLHNITNISPILINAADDSKCNTFHLALPEFDFEKITSSFLSSSLVYKLWDSFPILSPSKIKWNKFHLQRLKNFTTEHYNNDKLYLIHFHHFLMNCFLLKLDQISSGSENTAETDLSSISTIGFKPVEDKYSNYFVRRIVGNIIQQVPKKSMELQNMSTCESMDLSHDDYDDGNDDDDGDGDDDAIKKSYSTLKETLLQQKLNFKQDKLDKLKSFLFHPDLLSVYKELRLLEEEQSLTDIIKSYELIEELNTVTLCQSLNSALQVFENVNFFYSSITDSILLWFNNNININEIKTSYNVERSLETPIGFRDFYKFKLGGKTNLTETLLKYDSLFNEVSASNTGDLNKISVFQPLTVYNLGSLHFGVFESHSRFFSPDSSYVKVKRANYFDKLKSSVTVSIGKNNTFLCYEFDPEVPQKNIELRINFDNTVEMGCSLSWNPYPTSVKDENVSVQSFPFNVDCNLNMRLPTGLFIEVIRSDTVLGPFYIRQRYLSKGPACSNIWEEKFRCYLKTGTIVIFYDDGSVDILYSNGTKVNCTSFELKEISIEIDTIHKSKESNVVIGKSVSTNRSKTKKREKSKNSSEKASSKKGSKKKIAKSTKASLNSGNPKLIEVIETQQPAEMFLQISEHSVIAWDGLSTKYENDVLKEISKTLGLRMAFDSVNQELYLERSDKLTSLYTSDNLTVTFPDGSRITSIVEDGKTLSFLNNLDILTLEDTSDSSRGTQSDSESSHAEVNSEMSNFDTESVVKGEPFVFVDLSHFSEHSSYASVNYDNWMNEVEILLPGNVTVKIDTQGLFTIDSKDGESVNLTSHNLVFDANVLDHSLKQSKTVLFFENIDTTLKIQCQTEDSFGNVFSVDEYGRTNVLQVYWDIDRRNIYNCPRYPQNVERLFVFNRDLTGYEMIHTIQHGSLTSDKNVNVIKTSVECGFSDLYSLYYQSPILGNRSEEYLMSYENNLPTLMRRKDLIKPNKMPSHIWFNPALSAVMEGQLNKTINRRKLPEAVKIRKLFKIKDDDERLIISLFEALKKYMAFGEEICSRYLSFYPKDTRKGEIYKEGELHRENMFGSSSYYLSDNVTIIANMENNCVKSVEL